MIGRIAVLGLCMPASSAALAQASCTREQLPDSHTFQMIDGKYRKVHTISVNLNPASPSPQANDDGSMRR
jgi:hypothetical protein